MKVNILGTDVGNNTLLDRGLVIFPLLKVQRSRTDASKAVNDLQQWIRKRKEDILSNFIPKQTSSTSQPPTTTVETGLEKLRNISNGFHKPPRHMLPEHMLRCQSEDPIVFKMATTEPYYKSFMKIATDEPVEWWVETRRTKKEKKQPSSSIQIQNTTSKFWWNGIFYFHNSQV